MSTPTWLKSFYSPDEIASLNPKVVFDGKNKAVLQLRRASGGIVRVGYVMVLKKGRSSTTPATPLWEGEADKARMAILKKALEDADGKLIRGTL